MLRLVISACTLLACMLVVNGAWSTWSAFSTHCTKSCGGGVLVRTRCCDCNGCKGDAFETKPCNEQVCPADKTKEVECLQKTTRGDCCKFPFLYKGKSHNHCIGRWPWCSLTYKYQNKWGKCQNNGQWTSWSAFSKCSRTCGGGVHSRSRVCTNPKYCSSGDTRETARCNTKSCPVDRDVGGKENPGRNCEHIKNNRSKSPVKSGIYWIEIGGKKHEVYCDMVTDGGGWTLVWSYTFTDFSHFWSGKNAVTPRPDWPTDKNKGTVETSTTAPISETDYNALKFTLWKDVGHEFMVKSNINNWISCRENGGSLVHWRSGGLICRVVNNLTGKCGDIAPNKIEITTHDSWGAHSTGPNLYNSHTQGWLKTYYYFEDSTSGVNWPTHDPCSKNQLNHLRVANPHGNIYVR